MGGAESKSQSNHGPVLSAEERTKALTIFNSISHGAKSFSKEQFQRFTSHVVDSFTSSRLFDSLLKSDEQHHRHHGHQSDAHTSHEVTQHHFTSNLAKILLGRRVEKAQLCIFLASTTCNVVSAQDLTMFVSNVLKSYERILSAHCIAYRSWMFADAKDSYERLALSLLVDIFPPESEVTKLSAEGLPSFDDAQIFTEYDVETWLNKCSFFNQIFEHVLLCTFHFFDNPLDKMAFTPRVPQVRDTNWSKSQSILTLPAVLYLNHFLSGQQQACWKQLFASGSHGGSFSQLLGHIRNKGPTLIFIKDSDSHVFGGYAPTSWDINPKFQGNQSCFLFSANPSFKVYQATGLNENYMYLNHHVQTLPNGLGMGGQLDYFGLWIDQSFDNGHSKAGVRGCTTYGSPQLSGQTNFKVECIEVWILGKKRSEDEDEEENDDFELEGAEQTKKSILDKLDAADKALLEMVDKGTKSDAIREEPIVEEETAEHRKIVSLF